MVRKSWKRNLDGDRATTHVPPRSRLATESDKRTSSRSSASCVWRSDEGLLVANGLQRLIGLDRRDRRGRAPAGGGGDRSPRRAARRATPRAARRGLPRSRRRAGGAVPGSRADAPERLHGMGCRNAQLVLRGARRPPRGRADARRAHPRLRGLGRQLGDELGGGDADRAGEADPFATTSDRIWAAISPPSPSSRRAPVTSRKASSSAIGSTSGVHRRGRSHAPPRSSRRRARSRREEERVRAQPLRAHRRHRGVDAVAPWLRMTQPRRHRAPRRHRR